jgi:hypothetical protein
MEQIGGVRGSILDDDEEEKIPVIKPAPAKA